VGDDGKGLMALFDNRRIKPEKKGDGFTVDLSADERELLANLPLQLVELLDEDDAMDDEAVARLFPDAYTAVDTGFNEEYKRLMTDDLRDRHRAALETIASTAAAKRVTHDELYQWMTALTQLRLVIGTRLGVTEDMQPDGDDPGFNLYGYLSWLQEQVVEALSSQL
jgi:hypothetical protein